MRRWTHTILGSLARSHNDLRSLQRAVGEKIVAHWISTREQRTQWVQSVLLN
ncbi:hypothetical protein [Mycobacterium sp. D16R24]|uniref:hypothetical protein n=1 Tax=Mycobacterium sp. D16R24 TaxID=1855656 RepID=UPI00158FCD91|nr:hypothetical protein [Mycobacterium sp. D16R24]